VFPERVLGNCVQRMGRIRSFEASFHFFLNLAGDGASLTQAHYGSHRIDKFYMLIRRFINVGFRLLEREDWDLRAIELYNEVLTSAGGPLQYVDSSRRHDMILTLVIS